MIAIKLVTSFSRDAAKLMMAKTSKQGTRFTRTQKVIFRKTFRRINNYGKKIGAELAPRGAPEPRIRYVWGIPHKPGHLKRDRSWSSKASQWAGVIAPGLTTMSPRRSKPTGSKAAHASGAYSHMAEYGSAPPSGPEGDYPPHRFIDKTNIRMRNYAEGELAIAMSRALQEQFDQFGEI